MTSSRCSRRGFLGIGTAVGLTAAASARIRGALVETTNAPRPIVGIARIRDGHVAAAVEEAIGLLGGIAEVTRGRERILLKPNLVTNQSRCTTKPEVVGTLARLRKAAGKEVSIGEASVVCATRCEDILGPYQMSFFDQLGYTELARTLGIPLVNLHVGPFSTVPVPDGLFWEELVLSRALIETDLVCSVAMMKTHLYATVSLTLKNAIGLYPGVVYGSFRWWVHDNAFLGQSPGVAFEILDMARVNRLGLSVIDASTAMEGEGPTDGTLVPMNLIIAGTHPLATDLVGAQVMGIEPEEVPTFVWARKLGMSPAGLDEIEVRGTPIAEVRRPFVRATLIHPGGGGVDAPMPAPVPRCESIGDGRAAITWTEQAPQAVLRTNAAGKARMEWTEAPTARPSILEKNEVLRSPGWQPVVPSTPGRHEFDVSQAASTFFRLHQP